MSGDTEGFPQKTDVVTIDEGNDLTMQLVGGARVKFEISRHHGDVIACSRHRFACVTSLK